MSAPDTNLEKQKKQHKPALTGIRLVVIFAALLLIALVSWMFIQTDGPEGAERQIESGVGVEDAN